MKGRPDEGSFSNGINVEMSWAVDLAIHLYMKMPKQLRRQLSTWLTFDSMRPYGMHGNMYIVIQIMNAIYST